MLTLRHDGYEGEIRLHVLAPSGEAWIAQVPRRFPEERRDWRLWVRAKPGLPPRTGKSPLRLEIESRLRAWLLRRYRRPLFTLTFEELCALAERESRAARHGRGGRRL